MTGLLNKNLWLIHMISAVNLKHTLTESLPQPFRSFKSHEYLLTNCPPWLFLSLSSDQCSVQRRGQGRTEDCLVFRCLQILSVWAWAPGTGRGGLVGVWGPQFKSPWQVIPRHFTIYNATNITQSELASIRPIRWNAGRGSAKQFLARVEIKPNLLLAICNYQVSIPYKCSSRVSSASYPCASFHCHTHRP